MNEDISSNIAELIKNGASNFDLRNLYPDFNLSYRVIGLIAKKNGLSAILKDNNNKAKGSYLKSFHEPRKNARFLEAKEKYGSIVKDLVLSGKLISEICRHFNNELELRRNIHRILKDLDLYEIVQENFRIWKRKNQEKMTKLAAVKTKGTHFSRHIVTNEMIESMKKFKKDNLFYHEAKKIFKEAYKTNGAAWRTVLAEYGPLRKKPPYFLKGNLNIQWGKDAPKGSGIGVQGHIYVDGELLYFRSSLELRVFIYLMRNGIIFSPSKHVIRYMYNGVERNYHPDIVIGNSIYEIKPSSLITLEKNVLKEESLKNYCTGYGLIFGGYITEKTYDLSLVCLKDILILIEEGTITMTNKQLEKLKRWVK
jgi:hypothetical protein